MNIGAVGNDYRTNYAGYGATGDAKTDAFYSGLSSAVEKADERGEGEALGLTTLPYSDTQSYGMMAFYAENSTETDPVIRINCNYGGENRYFDVHVNEVDPRNASQMEMFALSCYQDDKGLTDRGSFGSYSRMKNYAGNAAMSGSFPDLQNVENLSEKLDWVSMLEQMAQQFLQNAQTYSQYLDCKNLAEKQAFWSDNKMKVGEDTLIVREGQVASLESGVSFYFDEEKHTVRCVDDRNPKLGRNILWEKSLTEEQFLNCDKLFERYRDKNTWSYKYDRYLAEEAFWDKYLNGEIDLAELVEG